ncbi:hypothetical protein ABMA28_014424 [Loxostege sticticalis]|uniref:LRRCT domain-containing protein n=1 Tax=Loxostege sticticalis TaxID=481309 RepID=A0ABD0TGR7_LOXSC
MAMSRPGGRPSPRCDVSNCRVSCAGVQFNENEEEDVISIATETGLNCPRIVLTLRDSTFDNNTMPLHWMSRMPTHIHVLNIIGGNLHHIPPTAFVGQFAGNIRALSLEDITISQWMSNTFVGLSSLRRLFIKNCVFDNISRNALRAIDGTIHTITVTHSGKWDPVAITGYSSSDNELDTVDFSFNDFGSSLRSTTFVGLKSCKTLYLNSCKITAIGAGTFDPLVNIELLFLSDNLLLKVPSGLFEPFLNGNRLKPRIHLENNPWKCDCLQRDLIQLSQHGLLPVDIVCSNPGHMLAKTISELEVYCQTVSRQPIVSVDVDLISPRMPKFSVGHPLTAFEQPCFYGTEPISNYSVKVVSPVALFECYNVSFIQNFKQLSRSLPLRDLTESNWLNPRFILQKSRYSMIQVSSTLANHGLLWYQSSCPNEVYCLNTVPNFLRVYNRVPDTEYTFCPFDLKRFEITTNNCVNYNLFEKEIDTSNVYYFMQNSPFLYVGVSVFCLGLGAMCVYMLIRKNPILLKGSKRLLFVKHRNVDALVLPPKVPLRKENSLLDSNVCLMKDTEIFTVPDDGKLHISHFMRSNSVRSDKSSTPTYISAMQPTEAQLAEWRIRHHFDKSESIISISSDISTFSWTSDRTTAEITTNVVYESL